MTNDEMNDEDIPQQQRQYQYKVREVDLNLIDQANVLLCMHQNLLWYIAELSIASVGLAQVLKHYSTSHIEQI